MPNYNVVVDFSNFKPYTYEDLAKPLKDYREEYEKELNKYIDIATKAQALELLASSPGDEAYYNKYKNYKDRLEALSLSLARGMNKGNKKAASMYREFLSELLPLSDMITKRDSLITELRAKLSNNPDALFTVDYSKASIDDMLKNKGMYETLSGKDLYAFGKSAGTTYASQRNSVGRKSAKDFAKLYFTIYKGVGAEEATKYLEENKDLFPQFKAIMDNIQKMNRTLRFGDAEEAANSFILLGFLDGLTYDEQHIADQEYISATARMQNETALEGIKAGERNTIRQIEASKFNSMVGARSAENVARISHTPVVWELPDGARYIDGTLFVENEGGKWRPYNPPTPTNYGLRIVTTGKNEDGSSYIVTQDTYSLTPELVPSLPAGLDLSRGIEWPN